MMANGVKPSTFWTITVPCRLQRARDAGLCARDRERAFMNVAMNIQIAPVAMKAVANLVYTLPVNSECD